MNAGVTDDAILHRMEPQFLRFDEVPAFALTAGVTARPLFGEGAMVNVIEFEAAQRSPLTATRTSSSASSCAACRRS